MGLSTEYRLLLFGTSKEHRPIARFVSATPFHSVSVGDRFDDTGQQRLQGEPVKGTPNEPIRYTVHSIKHIVVESAEGLVVAYCLNPHKGASSPVWDS